jgi:hypothetical protein
MIQLVQSNSKTKVVLFRPETEGDEDKKLHETALRNAGISHEYIHKDSDTSSEDLSNLISESECNVFIVVLGVLETYKLTHLLSVLSNYHIFIDDIQQVIASYSFSRSYVSALLDS